MPVNPHNPLLASLVARTTTAQVETSLRNSLDSLRMVALQTADLLGDGHAISSKAVGANLAYMQTGIGQLRMQIQAAPAEMRPLFERALGRLINTYESKFPHAAWKATFSTPAGAMRPLAAAQEPPMDALTHHEAPHRRAEGTQTRPLMTPPAAKPKAKEESGEKKSEALAAYSALRALQNPRGLNFSYRAMSSVGEQSTLHAVEKEIEKILETAKQALPHEQARLLGGLADIQKLFGARFSDAAWQRAFGGHAMPNTLSPVAPSVAAPPPAAALSSDAARPRAMLGAQASDARSLASVGHVGQLSAHSIAFDALDPEVAVMQTAARELTSAKQMRQPVNPSALERAIDQLIANNEKEPLGFRKNPMTAALAMLDSYRAQHKDAAWADAFSYRREDLSRLAGNKEGSPVADFTVLHHELREVQSLLKTVGFPTREFTHAEPGMIPHVQTAAWRINNMAAFRIQMDKTLAARTERNARRARPEQMQAFAHSMLAMLKTYGGVLKDREWQDTLSYRMSDLTRMAETGAA